MPRKASVKKFDLLPKMLPFINRVFFLISVAFVGFNIREAWKFTLKPAREFADTWASVITDFGPQSPDNLC